jgi:multicomponent Na+:H+ antiporter subunit G
MSPFEIVAAAGMLTGSVLCLLAAIGLHRMPDLYARMHAATKVPTMALLVTSTGAAFVLTDAESLTRLVLIVLLQFLTAPAAAHLLGRAAHDRRLTRSKHTVLDELEGPDLRP